MRPRHLRYVLLAAIGATAFALTPFAVAQGGDARTYEVTIENLTDGQPLTPPAVATHQKKHQLFQVGQPASVGVREIAENGNLAPLLAFLDADPFGVVSDVEVGGFPLVSPNVPGGVGGSAPDFPDSVTFEITAAPNARYLSWVSMLICTNDGFAGVDSLSLPGPVGGTQVAMTRGYDAMTEQNTEAFANIVPPCQALVGVTGDAGTGASDPALAEGGLIAHHDGVQGGADLVPGTHGWTDPVARITVERIS